ncbi:MAG: TolC family protein [Flavobacteriales bacterium]|nr:TolC family protein [Flavobacteriales bacterium]
MQDILVIFTSLSRMMSRRFGIWFLCLMGPVLCTAQEPPWTLQRCIDRVLEENMQIRQAELNNRSASNNLLQAKAELLPTINGNASQSYSFGRTVDPFTNQFITDRVRSNSFSLSSSVTLFNGLQMINSVKKSRYNYLAGLADTRKTRNDMTIAVINAYLQVLFADELVNTSIDQRKLTERQLERTKYMVEAGALAKGNQLDLEAQLATDQLQEVNAINQKDIAYLNLAQLMELESVGDFSIERPALEVTASQPVLEGPENLYQKALNTQPEVEAAEYRVLSATKDLAIARGAQSPSLVMRASYGSGYSGARQSLTDLSITGVDTIGYTAGGVEVLAPSYKATYETTPFNDQLDQNVNKAIGFYLTIPIFNGLRTRTAISGAKIALENAQLNQEAAQRQLLKEIQQAVADAKAAFNKYHASMKSTDAMEESFRYTDLRAEQGLVDAVTYIDAKNRLDKSRSDLLQAKYDYFFKLKILDYYAGNPLTF